MSVKKSHDMWLLTPGESPRQVQAGLEKKFQWMSTIFSDVDFNWRPGQAHDLGKDTEWEVPLMYVPS